GATARERRSAAQYFRSLTRSQLRHRLEPLRKSLYRGTFAYSSVAFVLAYYGIDVIQNAGRVLYAFHLPSSGSPSALEKDREEREKEWEAGEATSDYVVGAIQRIYRRHPSDTLWALTLQAWRESGSASEAIPGELTEAFLRYPAPLLRAASRVLPA